MRTALTDLLGCTLPIQQAGMGSVTTPALAAAVADAGGVGMLAAGGRPPQSVAAQLDQVEAMTSGVVGINLLMPFLSLEVLDLVAARTPLVECFYGEPDPRLVERIAAGGALAAWQVGSRDEAVAAADAGCALLVAQGVEAGGHVRGSVPLLPLLDAVLDAVDVPVVAAGGIATARGVAAVLAAGAAGARVGTAFLATPEADVHPDYLAALLAASDDDTVLTTAFSAAWPDAPHRVLRSAVDASDADPATRSPIPPTRSTPAPVDAMALYAGQRVGAVRELRPAGQLARELTEEAFDLLAEVSARRPPPPPARDRGAGGSRGGSSTPR